MKQQDMPKKTFSYTPRRSAAIFAGLLRFELLKLLKNRVTLATALLLLGFSLVSGFMEVTDGGGAENARWLLRACQTLNGRSLDDSLLTELRKYAPADGEYWIWTKEKRPYKALYNWVRKVSGYGLPLTEIDAARLSRDRLASIEEAWQMLYLTDAERDWWRAEETAVSNPLVWHSQIIPQAMVSGVANERVCLLFLAAIGLAAVFAGEVQHKTAPLISCTANGRRATYFAKIIAGCVFLLANYALNTGSFLLVLILLWGTDGLSAAVQLLYPFTMLPISTGRLVVILCVLQIFASLLFAAFALFLSVLLRNTLAVMGAVLGSFFGFVALFDVVPYSMRPLSQALMLLPSTLLQPRLVYEFRLFSLFGHYFTAYQIAPVVWLVLSALLILLGRVVYRREP